MLYANWIHGSEDFEPARSVRETVFVQEQGFDPKIEFDAFDQSAWHLIALDDELPIATGRIYLDEGKFHIGRICVIEPYRGFGVGSAVVRLLLSRAMAISAPGVHVSSQVQAKDFYKKFGFEETGEPYTPPGEHIEHVDMYADSENIILPASCSGSCAGCSGCGGAEEYNPEDDEE